MVQQLLQKLGVEIFAQPQLGVNGNLYGLTATWGIRKVQGR
jgi:hypothetical protein